MIVLVVAHIWGVVVIHLLVHIASYTSTKPVLNYVKVGVLRAIYGLVLFKIELAQLKSYRINSDGSQSLAAMLDLCARVVVKETPFNGSYTAVDVKRPEFHAAMRTDWKNVTGKHRV